MNIVIIGLGSMGKRRLRLIREMAPSFTVIGVDGRADRRNETEQMYGICCWSSIFEIQDHVDCAFVCTSPLSHASIITDCLIRGWHVFTELNLVDDGYDDNIELAQRQKCVLFMSSTFLYREELQYLRTRIARRKRWNYVYHVGQYLPDWHPWENYKDFFIGDKKTNGCREIMAIELPWLIDAFGEIISAQSISDKMTGLNIGFDDNYLIQFSHSGGNKGMLIIDVVSPIAVRKLEAYAEDAYLTWNGTPDSLFEYNSETKELEKVGLTEKAEHEEGYSTFIVENAYRKEIKEFFDVVLNHKEPLYGFEQDRTILKLIDSLGA